MGIFFMKRWPFREGERMKEKILVACLVVLMAGLTPSLARAITGNTLHEWCSSRTQSEREWCGAYVNAIADVLVDDNAINGYRACIADGVTIGQATDVVTKYLVEHPEDRHLTAPGMVAEAFREAFPCP